MKRINFSLFFCLLILSQFVLSNTIKVPSDYTTIQEAVNAAANGDTILVADGTYYEEIKFHFVDSVIIKSENGPNNCIIDCENGVMSSGFVFNSSNKKSVIEGFTIKNCTWGIYTYANSAPTIKKNIIDSCEIGIIISSGAQPIISDNKIRYNNNTDNYYKYGGGIRSSDSNPVIKYNDIESNSASRGGGIFCKYSGGEISHNTIEFNDNSGIYLEQSSTKVANNIIRDNKASKGGGVYCVKSNFALWDNRIYRNTGGGVFCKESSPSVIGNDIYLNSGYPEGNFILSCMYDNHQRPDSCFVDYVILSGGISITDNSHPKMQYNIISENKSFQSGAIYCDASSTADIFNNHILQNQSTVYGAVILENQESRLINNIIAYSVLNQNTEERLSRWYKTPLFMVYTYNGAKLDYVTYYFGFINNGPPGNVEISGCTGLNKTFAVETGERYWIEAPSDVTEFGNGGGLNVTVTLDTSSFTLDIKREDQYFIPHGCLAIVQPKFTSYKPDENIGGAGIVLRNENTVPEISYNDIYDNAGGALVFLDTISTKSAANDIIGSNGNISEDPKLDYFSYELLPGSPCIDAGIPDIEGLGLHPQDKLLNPRVFDGDDDGIDRIDIGAFELQFTFVKTEEYISICEGEEYEGWTETGVYERTLVSSTGNDSIVTTHLTVHTVYEMEEQVSICTGDAYLGYTESGIYRREFKSVNDCDSVVTTHLTVNATYDLTENVTICQGEEHKGWTASGTYHEDLKSVHDCDSSITTILTVAPKYNSTQTISICSGEEYNGHTETGEYTDTWQSAAGCDSVVTVNLTVYDSYEAEEYISICEGDDYMGLTERGVHRREFKNSNDCDSVIITHLTVNKAYHFENDITICKGDNYKGWTVKGRYEESLKTVNGCDSVIVTNLTVDPEFKPTFTNKNDTLTSDEVYASYQWYKNDVKINNATESTFIIVEKANYYFTATNDHGCMYNSDSRLIIPTSADYSENGVFNYKIIPNPNSGIFSFSIESNPPEKISLKLINNLGQTVEIRKMNHALVRQTERFDVSHLSSGVYYLIVSSKNLNASEKIIVH